PVRHRAGPGTEQPDGGLTMYVPPSALFLPSLVHSHQIVTQIDLFRADGKVERLDHIDGTVTAGRGSAVRRTCTVNLPDTSLIPRNPTDKLSMYGAQLRISRGIRYANGLTETVPLGVFRVDEVSGDVDEGPVTVTGSGLEVAIQDDRFTAPTKVSSTVTAVGGITSLIQ